MAQYEIELLPYTKNVNANEKSTSTPQFLAKGFVLFRRSDFYNDQQRFSDCT